MNFWSVAARTFLDVCNFIQESLGRVGCIAQLAVDWIPTILAAPAMMPITDAAILRGSAIGGCFE